MRKSITDLAAERGIQSDIDPRAILAGGAALTPPTGAATAFGLNEWMAWEEQFAREKAWLEDAERRNYELQQQARQWGY